MPITSTQLTELIKNHPDVEVLVETLDDSSETVLMPIEKVRIETDGAGAVSIILVT